ncbi:hypothetical protein ACFOY2_13810 [Nonomuraea purpurea]|uniref:Proline-rich protein n=1 Tax=Nonomuraea purpurea TaxID=1849276 RepID=A0ABV8G6G8_9ACTN
MTPDQYAQVVRDALADHPDREELLEDLDDHLIEIAAESDLPLEIRLGPPELYAEELAAAYGDRPRSRGERRWGPREWPRRAHARLMGEESYRSFVGFLPELRPGWWVLRGYVLAMLLLAMSGNGGLVPGNVGEWAAVAFGVWASVWFGRRAGRRWSALLAVGVNLVALLALLAGMATAESREWDGRTVAMAAAPQPQVWPDRASASDDVYNIKPYAKDGTPLREVYLYDQDGNPLTTQPGMYGYRVDESCGESVLNRYPLPLVKDGFTGDGQTMPEPTPACPSATPSPTPTR